MKVITFGGVTMSISREKIDTPQGKALLGIAQEHKACIKCAAPGTMLEVTMRIAQEPYDVVKVFRQVCGECRLDLNSS